MVYAIRSQLLGQLRASGFVKTKGKGDLKELNANSNNWALVKGVLMATLYPNICGVDRVKKVLYNRYILHILLHVMLHRVLFIVFNTFVSHNFNFTASTVNSRSTLQLQ